MAVFVSYSSRDKEAVDNIVRALTTAREQFWLDKELTGGELWWRKILKQIRESDVFIVALSENSEQSKPCQAELDYAIALDRPIIPVQIGSVESVMVNRVGERQIIDYREPNPDSAVALTTAVREAREQHVQLPQALPKEPPVPFEYLMRLNTTLDGSLGPREQDHLLAELRKGLNVDGNDEGARKGVTQLLRKLREHHDVTVFTRTEVDALLEFIATAPMPRITPPPPPKTPTPEDTTKAAAPRKRWRPSRRVTILAAAILAAVLLGGALSYAFWPSENQVIPPPDSESCPSSNAGTGSFSHWTVDPQHTSCEFGANVAALVTKTLQPRMSKPPPLFVLVGVPSPKTSQVYDITCVLDRKLVTCTGGNEAKVYVF